MLFLSTHRLFLWEKRLLALVLALLIGVDGMAGNRIRLRWDCLMGREVRSGETFGSELGLSGGEVVGCDSGWSVCKAVGSNSGRSEGENMEKVRCLLSPDKSICVVLSLDSLGRPYFLISVDGAPFMSVSCIGMQCRNRLRGMDNELNLQQGFSLLHAGESRLVSEAWQQPWGENKEMLDCHREMAYMLENEQGVGMSIELRVFNDGVGFRCHYNCEGLSDSLLTLLGETTTFDFAGQGMSWSIPANFESYEFLFREQPIVEVADANTPFTFCLENGLWGSIHEASLIQMPEMTLRRKENGSGLVAWLCPDNTGSGSVAEVPVDFSTAWRVITIGRRATDLINSQIVLNLNEPCRMPLDSAIRPMKYVGIWWGMHLGIQSWTPDERHGATTRHAMQYIDFAADNNIDAVLFEGWNQGWEQWGGRQEFDFTGAAPDLDIDSVIRYAHRRGVEVIIHHETGGNIPGYELQLDSALRWCVERGVHTVKTGYAGGFPERQLHHSQYGVRHYEEVMRKAMAAGVALDVHEPIKPTGLRRSSPNLMTAEGGRGMEWNAWSEGNPPSHETVLPFTRLLAGPMDYTPGIFDVTYRCLEGRADCRKWNQRDARECRVHSTIGHQVALWVVLYSPLQMAADLIENYGILGEDGCWQLHPMFQFFSDYDADIDWSRALDGEPGQFVVVARRAGEMFYLGAVTNEQARVVEVPLDFLPRWGRYEAVVYGDAPESDFEQNPTAYAIHRFAVRRGEPIRLELARGGGCAVLLRRIR